MTKWKLFDIFRALFAFLLIYFLISYVGLDKLITTLMSANPFYLSVAILLMAIVIGLNSLALLVLIKTLAKFEAWAFFKKYISSWAFGTILPGRLGDFSLGFILKKQIPASKVFVVVLVDKLITLFIYSFLTIFGISYFFTDIDAFNAIAIILAFWLVLLIALFSNKVRELAVNLLLKYFKTHKLAITYFSETLTFILTKNKKSLGQNFILTIIRLITITLIFYTLFLSFNVTANWLHLMIIVAISTIIALIPISINGLGIRELSFVFLCTQIGIPEPISASAAFVSTAFDYVIAGVIIAYNLSAKVIKIDKK